MNNQEISDNTIQFPDEQERHERAVVDALNRFESLMNHPTYQSLHNDTEAYAQLLLEKAGKYSATENLADDATTKLLVEIRNTTGWSDSTYDELIDPSSEHYDEVFAGIVERLKTTRGQQQDMAKQREALLVLLDLRVGALSYGVQRTDRWLKIVKVLSGESLSADE